MDVMFYLTFNFILYSFLGWSIEEVYSFAIAKTFKKEGFLIGPFKPMYGIAFTSLVICNEILEIQGVSLILLYFLIPTTVEYISGYILKHIFNKVYWDYSKYKYNIYGYITLSFSVCWMILCYIGINFFHPVVHELYLLAEKSLYIVLYTSLLLIIFDLILTMQDYKKILFNRKNIKD
ncbi:putative ABC transporter permease [Clostridium sp. YIM B02555]|uniref:putative ABC transporter permease n=1 Tax=Clostridium sp. YIM B02555 TaxID=2911968 RepID=UPI001EED864D|nr:putative ABC transporter permease [Clostridium sp. YIM B02555]